MATLSSHLLNSVNGTHASGVNILINQINPSGDKKIFYEAKKYTRKISQPYFELRSQEKSQNDTQFL